MEFVPVKSFDSYVSANIWLGKFKDAGIDCYLKDEYTVTIDPILSNAIGGIKLCVAKAQLRSAHDMLAAFEAQHQLRQRCPACSSINVAYISKPGAGNWLSAVASWLLSSLAVSAKQVYHCFDCGTEFDEIANEELNTIAAPHATDN